jgi:hypothetical protein
MPLVVPSVSTSRSRWRYPAKNPLLFLLGESRNVKRLECNNDDADDDVDDSNKPVWPTWAVGAL